MNFSNFFGDYPRIVSAYPACGKTSFCKFRCSNINAIDLDPAPFHQINNSTKGITYNEKFPQNYIDQIMNTINNSEDPTTLIFISTHKEVRDALVKAKIPYIIIFPDLSMKDIWISRMQKRNDNAEIIKKADMNYEKYIREIRDYESNNPLVYKYLMLDGDGVAITRDFTNFMIKEVCKDFLDKFYE